MTTQQINLDNYRFILHIIFSSSKRTILNIINWGEINKNGKIKFITKDGEKTKTKEEIISEHSSAEVVKFEELDLRSSLHYWFKRNQSHYNKKLVVDMTIETGEVIKQNCWNISLMVQANEEQIKIKPIF